MKKLLLYCAILFFAGTGLANAAEPLRIFIRGGAKTHGPGQHDWPRFLKDWTQLLNERGAKATGKQGFPTAEELDQTDVLIITLGLSEIWYDKVSGEPLWRALTEDTFDPERHVFRVETVAQTREWLEAIERIRAAYLPKLKIVFTVSPVPLKTTFRPVSAVTVKSGAESPTPMIRS